MNAFPQNAPNHTPNHLKSKITHRISGHRRGLTVGDQAEEDLAPHTRKRGAGGAGCARSLNRYHLQMITQILSLPLP